MKPIKIKPTKRSQGIIDKCKCIHTDNGIFSIMRTNKEVHCRICDAWWNSVELSGLNLSEEYLKNLFIYDDKIVESSEFLKNIKELYSILQELLIEVNEPIIKCLLIDAIEPTYRVLSRLESIETHSMVDLSGPEMTSVLNSISMEIDKLFHFISSPTISIGGGYKRGPVDIGHLYAIPQPYNAGVYGYTNIPPLQPFGGCGPYAPMIQYGQPIPQFAGYNPPVIDSRVISNRFGYCSQNESPIAKLHAFASHYRDSLVALFGVCAYQLSEKELEYHRSILKEISELLDKHQNSSSADNQSSKEESK